MTRKNSGEHWRRRLRPPEEAYWPTEKTDEDLGREEPEQIHPPLEDEGFKPPWWRMEANPRFGAIDPLVWRYRFHIIEHRFGRNYKFLGGFGALIDAKKAALEYLQKYGRMAQFIEICVLDRQENVTYVRRTLAEGWHVLRKLSMRRD